MIREPAAEERARQGGEAERGADEAQVAAAVPGGHDVGDDRLHTDQEAARADALERAERDELVHAPGEPGERGAYHEDHERELEDALAAAEFAQSAVDGKGDGGGEQIGRDRPGHPVHAVQLADDLGEGGGDDHLLQCGEEQGEQKGGEDQPDPVRTDPGRPVRRWWCRGCGGRFVLHQCDRAHAYRSLVALTAQFPH